VVLQRFAKFDGRAGRSEFWWFVLANVIAYVALLILMGIGFAISDGLGILLLLAAIAYYLVIIIPGVAVSIRRLHDTNKSGWLLLISLIPFGGIILLVFYIQEGTPGPNDYGVAPDPAV